MRKKVTRGKAVVETFVEKDMTEKDALVNAQLARILTTNDYDHEKKNQSSGLPQPITKLTMEQDLKLRQLELMCSKPEQKKKI